MLSAEEDEPVLEEVKELDVSESAPLRETHTLVAQVQERREEQQRQEKPPLSICSEFRKGKETAEFPCHCLAGTSLLPPKPSSSMCQQQEPSPHRAGPGAPSENAVGLTCTEHGLLGFAVKRNQKQQLERTPGTVLRVTRVQGKEAMCSGENCSSELW